MQENELPTCVLMYINMHAHHDLCSYNIIMPAEKNGRNCAGKLRCVSAELRGEIIIWDSGGVWEQPSTYLFEGQTVTLNELVSRLARHHHIPDNIANWVKTVTWEISCADISLVYNTLGERMYRHKDAIVNDIGHFYDVEKQHEANLLAINTAFPQDLDSIHADIRRINGEITVLKQADGFCKDEIRWLLRLYPRHTTKQTRHTYYCHVWEWRCRRR
jgi:hypothetical protein